MPYRLDSCTPLIEQIFKIKTTGEAGGMHHAFKAILPAAPKGALNSPATAYLSPANAKAAFSYAFGFLLPVNGSMYSLNDNWSAMMSSSS